MLSNILEQSIRKSVDKVGQPEGLAEAIISWLSDVAAGEEDPSDAASSEKRLERIYDLVHVDENDLVE